MNVASVLEPSTLLARLNRFAVALHLDGKRQVAHLPNSGRLRELLTPGRPTLVALPSRAPETSRRPTVNLPRRTVGDALFMLGPNGWVCVDARLPGRLLAEAVEQQRLDVFRGWRVKRLEYPVPQEPGTRLDLLLERGEALALVETKSVTLVERGTALFPDAPTVRGRRHVEVLLRAAEAGGAAFVVFVVQRRDALRFSPHRQADPAFAEALERAARGGVQVLAYRCGVDPPSVGIEEAIPVVL
ncbi:MAG: DNA/RNA nuclease SfsA [Limnochordaceae bacterium]|nr:DNA/RNA nuclease SfsA [Limnochordaceae bacterium]